MFLVHIIQLTELVTYVLHTNNMSSDGYIQWEAKSETAQSCNDTDMECECTTHSSGWQNDMHSSLHQHQYKRILYLNGPDIFSQIERFAVISLVSSRAQGVVQFKHVVLFYCNCTFQPLKNQRQTLSVRFTCYTKSKAYDLCLAFES